MQVRINTLFVLIPIFAGALCGQTPQPHAGWKLVPGGENLLVDGYWDTAKDGAAPASVQVSNGVLTASASSAYLGYPNVLGPRLETKGDFGVVATIRTAPGTSGLITLMGSLPTGTLYWQGWTQVEFGIDSSGSFVFGYWDGAHSSPAFQVLKGSVAPLTGTSSLELLHQQGQFLLYFNGVQYGPIADPGFFTLGYVYPGFLLFPNQKMELTQLAFEVPSGDTSARVTTQVGPFPYVHPGDSLGSLAAVTGRSFGTQVGTEQLALGRYDLTTPGVTGGAPDPAYAPKVVGEFNLIDVSNMFYSQVETGQGYFTFGDTDATLVDAKANGLPAHCHHLIGPNIYLPDWVVNGKFTAAQLTGIMQTHIRTVVGRYKGRCVSWDVVNEALNMDGTVSTTKNIWAQTIGPSYLDLAFQTAHEADPGAKLYYNDYYIENQTGKSWGLYNVIAGMQQRGVPIDGVGLQSHWMPDSPDPNWVPNHDSMVANMAHLAKMGLSVRLSELDVRLPLPATSAALESQASLYSTSVQACLDSPNCISIVVFGADDSTSWIPTYYPGYGAATLFDANFQPKPAYTSVMNALRTAALATPGAPALTAPAVTSAASYANQGVAPGEIIALFPTNVGPATFTGSGLDDSGKVLTLIGGTRVLFDGIAAPMIYTVRNQAAAVVPYEVAGHSSTQVQMEYNGIRSVAVSVPVLPAAPALFTVNAQGTGPVVANHLDGTVNSASNPAARGSIVVLFATGEGQRNPAGVTGALAPAYDTPVLPVSVSIGGVAAELGYAASAPGFAGLMQINLTIPPGAPIGAAVPVILTVGTAQSRSGVTIAIK